MPVATTCRRCGVRFVAEPRVIAASPGRRQCPRCRSNRRASEPGTGTERSDATRTTIDHHVRTDHLVILGASELVAARIPHQIFSKSSANYTVLCLPERRQGRKKRRQDGVLCVFEPRSGLFSSGLGQNSA